MKNYRHNHRQLTILRLKVDPARYQKEKTKGVTQSVELVGQQLKQHRQTTKKQRPLSALTYGVVVDVGVVIVRHSLYVNQRAAASWAAAYLAWIIVSKSQISRIRTFVLCTVRR